MIDSTPVLLAQHHELGGFDCGDEHLNTWLIERARKNEGKYSRTFVFSDEDNRIMGFYCLSAGAMARAFLEKRLQRNAPEVIPTTVLGRVAVDVSHQSQHLGSMLLHDALRRALQASTIVGSRLVVVHAKTDRLLGYYSRFGFRSLPDRPLTMVIPMETIARTLMPET